MDIFVTPVVKNKGAYLNYKNNYRAIAVAVSWPIVDTILFEKIIQSKIMICRLKPKPEVGFQCGGRSFFQTGSSS